MKKIKMLFLWLLCLYSSKNCAMELVYTPTISGTVEGLNLVDELLEKKSQTSGNLAISPGGRYLLISQKNKLYLLDLEKIPRKTNAVIKKDHVLVIHDHTMPTESQMPIAIIEQGNSLLICSAVNIIKNNHVEIIIRRIIDNKKSIIYQKTIAGSVTQMAFNDNGSCLAIAYKKIVKAKTKNSPTKETAEIIILDTASLNYTKPVNSIIPESSITALAFNADNTTLIAGTNKGAVHFLDLKNTQSEPKKTFIKNYPVINAITYLNEDTIELTTHDGCITILNKEGEVKKRFYSAYFGKTKVYKRNKTAIAPHSPAIAFCFSNIEKNEDDTQLGYIEFQAGNKIFSLQAPNFNPIFCKEDKGHYSHVFKRCFDCICVSHLVNNRYIIATLGIDSCIQIWEIPFSEKFRSLRSVSSHVLDNGILHNIEKQIKKQKKLDEKKKSIAKLHYVSNHDLPSEKILTLKEFLETVKKEGSQPKKISRPPPPPFSRANSVAVREPIRSIVEPVRSYSVDSGIKLINRLTSIFDIIHKQVPLEIKINMLITWLNTQEKPNVNEQDKYGNTALQWETQRSHIKIVQLLLRQRANPNTRNISSGNSPLHVAVQHGNEHIISLLLAHNANPNIQNNITNDTPLHSSTERNLCKIIIMLLHANAYSCIPNKDGNTPLHVGIIYGYIKAAKILLQHGSSKSIFWQNQQGNTPLHLLIEKGWNKIASKLVTKKAAPLNVQNYEGNTPLHIAVLTKNQKMIRILTDKGALFNIPNNTGKTVLDLMN